MYTPPVEEQMFVLEVNASLAKLLTSDGHENLSPELVETILNESGKFASEVYAPANRPGDIEGASHAHGAVHVPAALRTAYSQFVEAGWASVTAPADFGGQALPMIVSQAVNEQFASANGALMGCTQLTWGAIEAIHAYGTAEQKHLYLAGLVSGRWTGTMNLTEPQAGSDVGAIRTTAIRRDDGSYAIKGSKIFITFGDHDMADNIIHLVLARTPGAAEGSRGLSLFIVPKRLMTPAGEPGEQNDVQCISIEEKLGQHGSPTCVMEYGERDACVGYLLGEEFGGIQAMFTMMNNARVNVAMQGVGFAERAYQAADAYARERVQSRGIGVANAVTIIDHPDVQRMLLTQKATIEAARALVYFTAGALDLSTIGDATARQHARKLADLLTPAAKAYATDIGVEVTSSAIQIFGGLGFIEETGVAQHYRDVRITPIYEGTNGIQALDFVNRKLGPDNGAACYRLIAELNESLGSTPASSGIAHALEELGTNVAWMCAHAGTRDGAAGATPLLRQFAMIIAAALLDRQAAEARRRIAAGSGRIDFLRRKINTAEFYAMQILPQALALTPAITAGHAQLAAYA